MAKIIIKNFRAIDYAEIEIKPFTVIIGEQASGKSTISKLVYFFKSFPYDLGVATLKYCHSNFDTNKKEELKNNDIELGLKKVIKEELRLKFYEFFGSTKEELFEISFSDVDYSLRINSDEKISVNIYFENYAIDFENVRWSFNFLTKFSNSISQKKFIEEVFENIKRQNISKLFFIPASRSLITSILPASQSKFTAELDRNVEDKQIDYFVKTFLEDIDYFKRNFLFGKNLDEVLDQYELIFKKENRIAKLLRNKIKTILKADYQNGSAGEQLYNERFVKPISLDKASSGQQEIVWILLTLLVLLLEEKPSFVVIEEPEAHLYPKTQAQVVEYIAQFFNANDKNEVIITTHSTYILTVLNNLLLAKQISKKTNGVENAAIAESIDPQTWLDIDKFSAYYVGRNDEGQFIKSIINPETGLISVNELDDASDDIMDTFDDLMDIYRSVTV